MKRRNTLAIFGIITVLLFMGGLFTAAFTFSNSDLQPLTVAAAIIAVISGVATAILYYFMTSPGNEMETRWRKYFALPKEKITDFASELEQVRKNYEADTSPEKNGLDMKKDKRLKTADGKPLQHTGSIYYAYLVEANNELFKRKFSSFTLPGVVVYSKDEYYSQNPYALAETAERLYANRHNNILKNELKYFYNVKLNDEQGRELYISTIFIHRFHLPDGYLRGAMFPIIADPENCQGILVVDSLYWTDKLIANFMWRDLSFPENSPQAESEAEAETKAEGGSADDDLFGLD